MNDKKLIADARRAIAQVSAEVLSVRKLGRSGHWLFQVRLADGQEHAFRMSGTPSDRHGAPLALARDVRRFALGHYLT